MTSHELRRTVLNKLDELKRNIAMENGASLREFGELRFYAGAAFGVQLAKDMIEQTMKDEVYNDE